MQGFHLPLSRCGGSSSCLSQYAGHLPRRPCCCVLFSSPVSLVFCADVTHTSYVQHCSGWFSLRVRPWSVMSSCIHVFGLLVCFQSGVWFLRRVCRVWHDCTVCVISSGCVLVGYCVVQFIASLCACSCQSGLCVQVDKQGGSFESEYWCVCVCTWVCVGRSVVCVCALCVCVESHCLAAVVQFMGH